MVNAVQEFIASKVKTSLVLGGYREKDEEGNDLGGNARYPGIEQYFQNTERKISKVQARDIMSLTNALKEVTFAVQSTKFINNCDSFAKMQNQMGLDDLFKMTQNAEFVA